MKKFIFLIALSASLNILASDNNDNIDADAVFLQSQNSTKDGWMQGQLDAMDKIIEGLEQTKKYNDQIFQAQNKQIQDLQKAVEHLQSVNATLRRKVEEQKAAKGCCIIS